MEGGIVFSSDNNNVVALNYAIGRKGKYKRVMREVNGQLMQITDRRDQYYERRTWHDAHNENRIIKIGGWGVE